VEESKSCLTSTCSIAAAFLLFAINPLLDDLSGKASESVFKLGCAGGGFFLNSKEEKLLNTGGGSSEGIEVRGVPGSGIDTDTVLHNVKEPTCSSSEPQEELEETEEPED